jgi:hypothetical protein
MQVHNPAIAAVPNCHVPRILVSLLFFKTYLKVSLLRDQRASLRVECRRHCSPWKPLTTTSIQISVLSTTRAEAL